MTFPTQHGLVLLKSGHRYSRRIARDEANCFRLLHKNMTCISILMRFCVFFSYNL